MDRIPLINTFRILLLILALGASGSLLAQTDTASLDSDEMFKIARKEAFDGSRTNARKWLFRILEKSPGYDDVRIFLGRTYSWDGQRDNAREQFNIVLAKDPENNDALSALIDVELWDDKPEKALELANSGLNRTPNNTDLLYRKAKALHTLQKDVESASALQSLFAVDENHKDGLDLLKTIKLSGIKNSFTVNYSVDKFQRVFDPAQYAYLQYGRRTPYGSFFVRYNWANRFQTNGHQYEVDLYPNIARGIYAYINYGNSNTLLFSQNRFGGELYFKLPYSMEGSVGLRYLYFGGGSQVTMYTGTLGKYFGNYWASARVFLTPGKAGLSNSYIFQLRRYLEDAQNYVALVGGFGFSPDITNSSQVSGDPSTRVLISSLRSRRIGVDYRRTFGINWRAEVGVNYAKQEYLFDVGNLIGVYTGTITVQYRF